MVMSYPLVVCVHDHFASEAEFLNYPRGNEETISARTADRLERAAALVGGGKERLDVQLPQCDVERLAEGGDGGKEVEAKRPREPPASEQCCTCFRAYSAPRLPA